MFNCYQHWYMIEIQDAGGTGHLLHNKDVMTHGEPSGNDCVQNMKTTPYRGYLISPSIGVRNLVR